jgi:prevent-host-death family protein
MRTISSVEAQNRFGELLDSAQREPISITRRGRPIAFVLSPHEYEALSQGQKAAKNQASITAAQAAIAAFRGSGSKGTTESLLAERHADRLREG